MKRNCEREVVDIIGLAETANEAYEALKASFEGKTVTTLGALLIGVIKFTYDDRAHSIEEHITEFDKKWSYMRSMLKGAVPDNLKDLGKILTHLSKSDQAKSTFLLATLPPYYNQLIENIQMRTGMTYGDTITHLKTYAPGRQKGKRREQGGDSVQNSVVLKTEAG